ncbi:hypothetical protein OAO01_04245 [Oligoflexia bacterium]|nr:hypothetical protein [Oligoflexia bacterium]
MQNNTVRPSSKLLISFLFCLVLASCSFVKRNTVGLFLDDGPVQTTESTDASEPFKSSPPQSGLNPKTTKVDIEKFEPNTESEASTVEIIWEIPKEPTDGFIIHYGYTKNNLEFQTRLDAEQLEKYEDPKFGFVYRHLMQEMSTEQALFFAMAAIRNDTVSELSEVFEIKPATVK